MFRSYLTILFKWAIIVVVSSNNDAETVEPKEEKKTEETQMDFAANIEKVKEVSELF